MTRMVSCRAGWDNGTMKLAYQLLGNLAFRVQLGNRLWKPDFLTMPLTGMVHPAGKPQMHAIRTHEAPSNICHKQLLQCRAPVMYSAVIGATYFAGSMFQSSQASTYSLEYLTWAEKSCSQSTDQAGKIHGQPRVLLGTHGQVLHVALRRRWETSLHTRALRCILARVQMKTKALIVPNVWISMGFLSNRTFLGNFFL